MRARGVGLPVGAGLALGPGVAVAAGVGPGGVASGGVGAGGVAVGVVVEQAASCAVAAPMPPSRSASLVGRPGRIVISLHCLAGAPAATNSQR